MLLEDERVEAKDLEVLLMSTVHRDGAEAEVEKMLADSGRSLRKLLLFGGTTEGRELAVKLVRSGLSVCVCVATHVGAEQLPIGMPGLEVTCGRLDVFAMSRLMKQGFGAVIDATHPYAVEVSANVRQAADIVRVPYVRIIRPSIDFSDCAVASSTAEACAMVPDDGGNVLATTGNKEIYCYTAIADFAKRVYARVLPDEVSVESVITTGIPEDHVIGAKGPFSLEQNVETMRKLGIRHMITKESGATGGFVEKLEAARQCGVDVIVVKRPQDEDGLLPEELVAILSRLAPKLPEKRG